MLSSARTSHLQAHHRFARVTRRGRTRVRRWTIRPAPPRVQSRAIGRTPPPGTSRIVLTPDAIPCVAAIGILADYGPSRTAIQFVGAIVGAGGGGTSGARRRGFNSRTRFPPTRDPGATSLVEFDPRGRRARRCRRALSGDASRSRTYPRWPSSPSVERTRNLSADALIRYTPRKSHPDRRTTTVIAQVRIRGCSRT